MARIPQYFNMGCRLHSQLVQSLEAHQLRTGHASGPAAAVQYNLKRAASKQTKECQQRARLLGDALRPDMSLGCYHTHGLPDRQLVGQTRERLPSAFPYRNRKPHRRHSGTKLAVLNAATTETPGKASTSFLR